MVSISTGMFSTAFISVVLVIGSWLIMHYAVSSGNYRRCYYITIFTIFLIFFPILFFISGGYRSGMPAVFIFASLFTAMMLDGWQVFAMLALELFVYNTVCWICYYFPNLVIPFASEKAILADINFAYTAVSIACAVVIFFHLKEYKQQQKLLNEQNVALKTMDDAKSTFLTTVAHEVKNPLNIISLHAEDTAELLDEESIDYQQIRENQKIIQESVLRLDNVLNDLMDTVSIEQGRLHLKFEKAYLKDVVEMSTAVWKKMYLNGKTKIKITTHIEDGLPAVYTDQNRLIQVMQNLLRNSYKHTKNGEVIVTLKHTEEGQMICVQDDGEGMSKEMKEKALEGYVSLDKDYWRHGIGLYVCHQIIKAHGGKIWIESELNVGTKVYFVIPEKEVANVREN